MHEPVIPTELEGWPKATRRENIGLLARLRYEWKHLSPDAQRDGLVFQNYAGLFWRVMCLDTMQKQQALVDPLYDSYDRLCDLAENLTGGRATPRQADEQRAQEPQRGIKDDARMRIPYVTSPMFSFLSFLFD